jgi:hypothetical protein
MATRRPARDVRTLRAITAEPQCIRRATTPRCAMPRHSKRIAERVRRRARSPVAREQHASRRQPASLRGNTPPMLF